MGQAHRAPRQHYGRKFQITDHAVQRLRERVEEEFKARPFDDLANLLDERIRNAVDKFDVTDHSYGGSTSTIYKFTNRAGSKTYLAVVREGTCVTVLDEDMLEKNIENASWSRPLNTPFASALAGVKATVKPGGGGVGIAQRVRVCVTCKCPFEDPHRPTSPTCHQCSVSDVPSQSAAKSVDPVESAGALYARAKYAVLAAHVHVRVLEEQFEKQIAAARQAVEIAKDEEAKAELALHNSLQNIANQTKGTK